MCLYIGGRLYLIIDTPEDNYVSVLAHPKFFKFSHEAVFQLQAYAPKSAFILYKTKVW